MLLLALAAERNVTVEAFAHCPLLLIEVISGERGLVGTVVVRR
jgi:hypothetical protein